MPQLYTIVFLAAVLCWGADKPPRPLSPKVQARMQADPLPHPRLFLHRDAEAALRLRLAAEPRLAAAAAYNRRRSDVLLDSPVLERRMEGRRLLYVSRNALERIGTLAMTYRLTGDARYAERARAEMLAVAAFSDWNPSHFLDVGEMTLALAIGYDWLYDQLTASERQTIRGAIVEKGLKPSLVPNQWWVNGNNNWNQVCHAGMAAGALAIHEDAPELAATIIDRAVQGLPKAMAEFGPDGNYPEGPMYWSYGTSFNVILIHAFESALGSDFQLSETAGFLDSARYMVHVTGPTGLYFNYSDCNFGAGVEPALFWFAQRTKDPGILFHQLDRLDRYSALNGERSGNRLFPFLLIWAGDLTAAEPPARTWRGHGTTPVALMRTDWSDDALFVGVKGGRANAPHGHVDVGSFVFDADGVRWAADPGMQSYESLESVGVKMWDSSPNGQRWDVFRIGPMSHNILTVDGKKPVIGGFAPISTFRAGKDDDTPRAVIDMDATYAGQLAAAARGIALLPQRAVLVQDEVKGRPEGDVTVRWAMFTSATVTLHTGGRAELAIGEKRLQLQVLEPAGATIRIYPTDPPPRDYDAANPGTCILGFETPVPAGADIRLRVLLTPGTDPPAADAPTLGSLSAW